MFCITIINKNKSTVFLENTIIIELSNTDEQFIVESDRSDNILLSIDFCFWKIITVNIGLNTTIFYYQICLDTGYLFNIINTNFAKIITKINIYTIDYSINISNIELLYLPIKYTVFYIYFLFIIDNSNRHGFVKIKIRVYIVNIIKLNLLININIIDCKNIVTNLDSNYIFIYLYKNFVFVINYKLKIGYIISILIYIIWQIIISTIFSAIILIKIKLNFSDQNLIFKSINSTIILQLIYYIYLVNTNFYILKSLTIYLFLLLYSDIFILEQFPTRIILLSIGSIKTLPNWLVYLSNY